MSRLYDAIREALRHYRCTHWQQDEDNGGLPLPDALTPPWGDGTVRMGMEEIDLIADEVADALAALGKPFCWCVESTNSADWAFAATKEDVQINAKLMDRDCIKSEPFPLYRAAVESLAPVAPDEWMKAVQLAYGHLWHVNNESAAPIPMRSPETAAYEARKALRDLLTHEERGEAINYVGALIGRYSFDPAPIPSTAPAKDHESDPIEPRRQDDWASAPAPQAQPVSGVLTLTPSDLPPDKLKEYLELCDEADALWILAAGGGASPVSAPDDRELMARARLLCEWIAETPHQRGSINGAAAQLEASLRARLQEGAK